MSDDRPDPNRSGGHDEVAAVDRTDAHDPIEGDFFDDRSALDDLGPPVPEDVLDDEGELPPEVLAEIEAAALLDGAEAQALMAGADDVAPEHVNDRTAAQDAPSELFEGVPDPETQPLFANIPDPEDDPVPRPITVSGPIDDPERFQSASTEYLMPVVRPAPERPAPARRPPSEQPRLASPAPPPLPPPLHDAPRRLEEPVIQHEPSVILDLGLSDDDELTGIYQPEPREGTRERVRGRLVVRGGEDDGKTWYVNRAETLVGRGNDCDIVVLDIAVSREHLKLVRHDEGFELVDLDSANGTFVNERRTTRCELYDGDVIEVGSLVAEYSTVGAARIRATPMAARTTDPGKALPVSPPSSRVPYAWLALWCLTTFVAVLGAMYITRALLADDEAEAPADEGSSAQAKAWFEKAERALRQREWGAARQHAEVARKLAPGGLPHDPLRERIDRLERQEKAVARARLELDRGEVEAAAALVADIEVDSPFASEAQALRARIGHARLDEKATQAEKAMGRGQNEAARLLAEQVLAEDAGHARARAVVEAVRAAQKQAPAAGAEPAADAESDRARRDMSAASRHYRKGRFADAVVAYEKAARRDVSSKLQRQARARARSVQDFARRLKAGESAARERRALDAARELEKALALDRKLGGYHRGRIRKQLADPYYFQAIRAFSRQRYAQAAAKTRDVLSIEPGHALAGRLLEKMSGTAPRLLDQARRMRGSDPRQARALAEAVMAIEGKGSALGREAKALLAEL